MFIAFEGPDNVGKSTSARTLDAAQQPDYNIDKERHEQSVADQEPGSLFPHCYDRIDWFTHMVYRLALPDREWNDARVRTVFAMPETHLVVKIHHPDFADFTAEEVVDTPIARVNPMYYYFGDFFMGLNEMRDYALFRTVSLVEVRHNSKDGTYSQELRAFNSPVTEWNPWGNPVTNDDDLLALLQADEKSRA